MTLIRRATPADAEPLALLAAETFPLACPPGTAPEDIRGFIEANFRPEQFAAHAADPDRILLVAVPDEPALPGTAPARLLGYTLTNIGSPEDPEIRSALTAAGTEPGEATAEISKVYVREDTHGTGVARELLVRTLDEIAERAAAPVYLGVNQQNERAQRFYAKHGFARAGTKHFLVGGQVHDDFVLVRAS
ncbi:GNAT family N-acetyltransferase [Leucobacter sp. M11]|uniref:GNAT family N-acetyltransferase n=1 Tax=Leucobacter sp. M11 TaxID=2993565 RepID=UPI002D7E4D66|nr:N-acetyltransferase [Leucobacter sp. M11]MEB4615315.1 N-acetyltransferase [Leucobacter sp. M11]